MEMCMCPGCKKIIQLSGFEGADVSQTTAVVRSMIAEIIKICCDTCHTTFEVKP